MKTYKKKLASLLLAGSFMPAFGQMNGGENLVMHKIDGTVQSYSLDDIDKLTFTPSELSVWLFNGFSTLSELDGIQKITFGEAVLAVEKKMAAAEVRVTYIPQVECVKVEYSSPVRGIFVYNLQGGMMRQAHPDESPAMISLAGMPTGVYVVSVHTDSGVVTRKMAKR